MIIYNNPKETCKNKLKTTKKQITTIQKTKKNHKKNIHICELEIGWNLGRLF